MFAGHCRGLAADQCDTSFASLISKLPREIQSSLAGFWFSAGLVSLVPAEFLSSAALLAQRLPLGVLSTVLAQAWEQLFTSEHQDIRIQSMWYQVRIPEYRQSKVACVFGTCAFTDVSLHHSISHCAESLCNAAAQPRNCCRCVGIFFVVLELYLRCPLSNRQELNSQLVAIELDKTPLCILASDTNNRLHADCQFQPF